MQAAVLSNVVQRLQVTVSQVNHVDVVAHAGTINGRVVVTEDVQVLAATHSNLRDKGHQVVRDARRVLTDTTGLVRTNGVEVTQQSNIPLGVGSSQINQHVLNVLLGAAVAGLRIHVHLLDQRHGLGLTVHGSGGGEHDGVAVSLVHCVQQVQGASHVGLVVPQRLLCGLAHSLQTRKVNHSVGANLLEESLHTFKVEQVNLVELGGAASEFSDALEGLLGRVREVIHDNDVVACLEQFKYSVGADVAGAAGNEYLHDVLSGFIYPEKVLRMGDKSC